MATLLTMLTDLRGRLNDPSDTQVAKADKIRYLNHGIKGTWPSLYKVVRDKTSLDLIADTYEYNLPSTFGPDAKIFRVEVESTVTAGRWYPVEKFRIFPGSPLVLVFDEWPGASSTDTSAIRISGAVRLVEMAADADVYDGPAGTDEIPVLYAMACCAGGRLDDRIDHTRYSTVAAQNGVGVETIQGSAQFWFSQFDLALDKAAMPLPGF